VTHLEVDTLRLGDVHRLVNVHDPIIIRGYLKIINKTSLNDREFGESAEILYFWLVLEEGTV
jgi:hypothetical protein